MRAAEAVISVFQMKFLDTDRLSVSDVTRFWRERTESQWPRSQSRLNRTVSAGVIVTPKLPDQGRKSLMSYRVYPPPACHSIAGDRRNEKERDPPVPSTESSSFRFSCFPGDPWRKKSCRTAPSTSRPLAGRPWAESVNS